MQGFYPKLLKQAFSLSKDHPIFWVAGLFLVWPNLLRALFWSAIIISLIDGPQVYQTGQAMERGNVWFGLMFIFVICLMVAYYYRSRAVVGVAVKQLRNQSNVEKVKVYQEADPFTWELIKFGLTFSAGIILLLAFLSSPVMFLADHGFDNRAFILGLFAFGVFLPIFVLLYYSLIFVPMFAVIYQVPVWDSLKISLDLVKRNWIYLIWASVLLFLLEILAVVAGLVLIYLFGLGFVFLVQIFYNVGGSDALSGLTQSFIFLSGVIVFLVSQSFVAVFQRIFWAIMFFEFIKPVKTEQEVPVESVSEAASQ